MAKGCFSKCSRAHWLSLFRAALLLRQDVAAIDPHLYADHAVGRPRFGEPILDVGTQSVQRQASLQVPLGACDFVSVQPAGDAHLDPLAAEPQRRVHRLAHRPAETHALFQLQRDRLRHELGIELRLMHFLDIDEHFPRSALLQLLLQLVDLRAFAPDDDPGTRGAYDDAQLVPRTLDLHRADARGFELVLELFLELDVFEKQFVVVALHKPARPPRLGIAEAKSVWMDLLSHKFLIVDVSLDASSNLQL